jgi:thioredoxin-like negative regulator of GroEL
MRTALMGVAVLGLLAVPAAAKDRTGYTAIAAGSLAEAETTLNAERAIFPQRPELMLNLAAVYARTNRQAQARALYADVLSRDDVAMELGDGSTVSAHALAKTGLSRIGATMAAR